ncbi:MAG TPA: extracellular solute-binding protein [Clostridiales bacterium]|nr:extracellular solute-binding protein [Clostridiales bacterium]HPV01236.1 extracellular solute-binding protein [Clostridiales bacterium]
MKKVKLIALLLVAVMIFGVATACSKSNQGSDQPGAPSSDSTGGDTNQPGAPAEPPKEPITFTMFQADPGEAPPESNKIIKKIREMTGVTVEIEYLVGDMEQKVGIMIAGGDYPDLIGPGQARGQFLNAGAFVALDDLLPKYPNLWKHYEPYLDVLRSVSSDGKIYIMDIWSREYWLNDGKDTEYQAGYNGPAFWTQKDVLAWDNYSNPRQLDEYFDLLLRYYKAHPTIDGQPTLGFEIHSQDWRSFCLKNAPQHLIGGRNEGDVVVKPDLTVEIYQNKDYAKTYYKKLNEMFKQGLISPETFSRNYDEYLSVLSTGRVLGMFDQQWNFANAENVLISEGRYERTYVPVGVSLDGSPVSYNRYKSAGIVGGNGMGISVKCKDVERALEFLDFMLREDVQKLCYWGIEGEDYYVDENGRYRRTEEQRANFNNPDWVKANSGINFANLFPKIQGRYSDGNAAGAGNQPEERIEGMSEYDKEFLAKYGFSDRSEFLPLAEYAGYPEVWSIFSTMDEDNPVKAIFNDITDLQNRYLPGVIMADDFESAWNEYVKRYENVDYPMLEKEIEKEIKARYKK